MSGRSLAALRAAAVTHTRELLAVTHTRELLLRIIQKTVMDNQNSPKGIHVVEDIIIIN